MGIMETTVLEMHERNQRSTGTDRIYKVGISSYTYSFARGSRPFQKPEHILTPFDLIDKAVMIGAQVVQIADNMPLEVYGDEELEKIRLYAAKRGIELEAGMSRATEERLADYIRITGRIGARFLRLVIHGGDFTPDFQECCRILSSVIPLLEESGIILGIENHDSFSVRDCARMAALLAHPQIGLTVDTVNSLSREETIGEVLQYMAPYCACLHIKDYVIRRINGGGGLKITGVCAGTGRVDIRRCFEECRTRSSHAFNVILESWMEPCGTLEETLQMEDEWAEAGVLLLKKIVLWGK